MCAMCVCEHNQCLFATFVSALRSQCPLNENNFTDEIEYNNFFFRLREKGFTFDPKNAFGWLSYEFDTFGSLKTSTVTSTTTPFPDPI